MTGKFKTLLTVTVLVAGLGLAVQAMAQNPDHQGDRQGPSQLTNDNWHCDHWYRNVVPRHMAACSWDHDRDRDWCDRDDCQMADHHGRRDRAREDDNSTPHRSSGHCW